MKNFNTISEKSWGYIASCSTEAILFASWRCREYFQNKDVILLSSEYSHYCVDKIAKIINIKNYRIASNKKGDINLDEFKKFLDSKLFKKGIAVFFVATIGSTITSSIDDFKSVKKILDEKNILNYIHLDAALDGAFLPLTENYYLGSDFDSVNISGHKFIGSPTPSGILLMDKKYISKRFIEYINNDDMTLGGSRNGLSPVLLYNNLKNMGSKQGLLKRYKLCLRKSNEFLSVLLDNDIKAWKNDKAITIVLEDIPDIIFNKWHMPKYKNLATLTCLPKFTKNMLDNLIFDINNPLSIKEQDFKHVPVDLTPL